MRARAPANTRAHVHTCLYPGGGEEQVFELISFLSPAATTRRPLAPRRPRQPLPSPLAILGRIVYVIFISHELPSDFIFGYRVRTLRASISPHRGVTRVYASARARTRFIRDRRETNVATVNDE